MIIELLRASDQVLRRLNVFALPRPFASNTGVPARPASYGPIALAASAIPIRRIRDKDFVRPAGIAESAIAHVGGGAVYIIERECAHRSTQMEGTAASLVVRNTPITAGSHEMLFTDLDGLDRALVGAVDLNCARLRQITGHCRRPKAHRGAQCGGDQQICLHLHRILPFARV